jgi:class 3 adenylate cyclase/streptogramin lyase
MVRARASRRRLATVLFIDIVDSTRLASDVGDRRWRDFLGEFRRRVRRALKSHGGHEEDTAGDGFFATFDQPARAVRAAAAVLREAHLIGLDVRCGLHAGELEHIDGKLGGIAAHIGARTMALAEPGEILVSATVHDLVTGSQIEFDDEREEQLKGVPGTWRLYRVSGVDGQRLSSPLEIGEAADRQSTIAGSRGMRATWVALGAGAMLVVIMVAGSMLARPPDQAGESPSPSANLPVTLLRIDATTGEIATQVQDRYLAIGYPSPLWEVDGNLWQVNAVDAIRRDMLTGEVAATVRLPLSTTTANSVLFAFGSIWAVGQPIRDQLVRVDPLNGREIAVIPIPSIRYAELHAGPDAIWLLTLAGTLIEIDPLTNEIIGDYALGTETVADGFTILGNTAWLCECGIGRVTKFDLGTHESSPASQFAQRGFVVPSSSEGSQAGPSSANGEVWLLDSGAGTVTEINLETGEAGRPLAVARPTLDVEFGLGALWVAGWTEVRAVDLETGDSQSIEMPPGFWASSIAVDEATGSVWVSSCYTEDEFECE